jgi:peptide/nickel transport system substrate-binding protein
MRGRCWVISVAVVALGLALSACSSPPKPIKHHRTTTTAAHPATTTTVTKAPATTAIPSRNVATFAETPGEPPSYIAPLTPIGYATTANTAQFSSLMWRPLVWPGTGETLGPNTTNSLYSSISYNAADTQVTITLKDWKWSDGAAVTSRDITFFLDLVEANASQWSGSVPGQLPSNIASARITGPRTLVLDLKGAWSPFWFTDNELSLITPLPQQRWDKTSPTSKDANYDQTPAGARAVWSFLTSQAKQTSTFATNPLWKVVDGPWKLQRFASNGQAMFVPNPAYSGSNPASLAAFVEVPFADSTAELNALAAGQIDVGYLPYDALADQSVLAKAGFSLTAWQGLALAGMIPNLANARVGPILRQTYVRQALRQLVDQGDIVSSIFGGFANPGYGPVPLDPSDPYASPTEMSNPYPFDVNDASARLAAHGWSKGSPDVCADPKACGPGISKGESLALSVAYPAGDPDLAEELELFKTAAIQAGVVIDLQAETPKTFARSVRACTSSCTWELATYQGYPFRVIPTGDGLFVKGSAGDIGGYDNATNAANVAATLHTPSPGAFYTYENYLVSQVPWIWLPSPDYRLTEVTSSLRGVTPQNAYLYLDPESWSFSSQ